MEREKTRETLIKKSSLIRRIKKKYFVSALFLLIFGWQYSQMRETSLQFLDREGTVHTFTLPAKDKKRLFDLMQELFAHDNFAYTLLGSKPLSWATYRQSWPFVDWGTFRDSLNKYHRVLRSGWKTWEKYRHLFPAENFWADHSKSDPEWISILLVNEEQFNTVVINNKKDFQDVLRREMVDGFQMLKEAKNRSLMNDILEGHQALLGIVLGYGRDNSWKFLKGCEKREPIGWVWDEKGYPTCTSMQLSPEISLTEWYLTLYSCPSFAGDPNSEESLALKKDYLLTKQKVLNYYKGKDFLEATLSLLAGYRPHE